MVAQEGCGKRQFPFPRDWYGHQSQRLKYDMYAGSSALSKKGVQIFTPAPISTTGILTSTTHIDSLVQDCNFFIASAFEILQSCIKPSICNVMSALKIKQGPAIWMRDCYKHPLVILWPVFQEPWASDTVVMDLMSPSHRPKRHYRIHVASTAQGDEKVGQSHCPATGTRDILFQGL